MRMGGHRHTLEALAPVGRPGTNFIGSKMGLKDGSGRAENLAPEGLNPRTDHPVMSRYTDYAIPAHKYVNICRRWKIHI